MSIDLSPRAIYRRLPRLAKPYRAILLLALGDTDAHNVQLAFQALLACINEWNRSFDASGGGAGAARLVTCAGAASTYR